MNAVVAKANAHIQALAPYVPGKPSSWLQREFGIDHPVKLASNENPLGASPKVVEALAKISADTLGLYPDGSGFDLKQAIAQKHKIDPEQVTLGNGSEEIIRLVIQSLAKPNDSILIPEYSFIAYPLTAQSLNVQVDRVALVNWQVDLDAMLSAIHEKTKVIFIANPGNPIGNYVGHQPLKSFLQKVPSDVCVVLDEAYAEYMSQDDYPDSLALLQSFDNLCVTRTFSKIYGLAGLRVGYSLCAPELANLLNRIRNPFNCNSLAQIAATRALADTDHVSQTKALTLQGLEQFAHFFEQKGIEVISQSGNFITIDLKQDAQSLNQQLLRKGVIVRDLKPYQLPNVLRISIGSQAQNQQCVEALDELLP